MGNWRGQYGRAQKGEYEGELIRDAVGSFGIIVGFAFCFLIIGLLWAIIPGFDEYRKQHVWHAIIVYGISYVVGHFAHDYRRQLQEKMIRAYDDTALTFEYGMLSQRQRSSRRWGYVFGFVIIGALVAYLMSK